jgi:hypothetical protein
MTCKFLYDVILGNHLIIVLPLAVFGMILLLDVGFAVCLPSQISAKH